MACDSLLVVTEIRQALAEARTLEDVLLIRDKAEAMRRLLKLKDESLAAQNDMAEITVRAEILLGESLKKLETAQGKRRDLTSSRTDTKLTADEIGICRMDKHRWQTMATAKRLVTRMVKEATESGKEFSRAMVYREGQRIRKEAEGESNHAPAKLGQFDFVGMIRCACDKVWDKCPAQWRGGLVNVLRSIADEFEERLQHGHGRRAGTDTASVA